MAGTVANYSFERGATLLLALRLTAGLPAAVASITARMRRVAEGNDQVAASEPVAAEFDVSFVAAAGAEPAYWLLVVPAGESADLAIGQYQASARIVLAGSGFVEFTDPVALEITEPV